MWVVLLGIVQTYVYLEKYSNRVDLTISPPYAPYLTFLSPTSNPFETPTLRGILTLYQPNLT